MRMFVAVAEPDLGQSLRFWGVLSVVSLAVGVLFGVIRPGNVSGPSRLGNGRRMWPLFVCLLLGFSVWIGAQLVYVSLRQAQLTASSSATHPVAFDTTLFTPGDWAWIACVPPMLAALTMLAGAVALPVHGVRRGLSALRRLGLRSPGRALWMGLVGITLAMPLVMLVLNADELVYQRIGYEHPMEHDLLRIMGERPGAGVQIALVLGATVAAPLFEELLFRGHLQTLIRALLMRLTRSNRNTTDPLPTVNPDDASLPTELSPPTRPRPVVWQSWMAIVVASALFALVHPQWMQPAIFCLALCLGFAYERSGNLWVSIVMHAAFNSVETIWFFLHQSGG